MAQEHRRGRKAEYTDRPLTEEEKIFAEEHHDFLYIYMRNRHLLIEEWYDLLVIPYLQAVKKYCSRPELQEAYVFEQIAYKVLSCAQHHHYRKMNTLKCRPSGGIYSLNQMLEGDNPFSEFQVDAWWIDKTKDVEAYVIEKEFLNDIYNHTEHYADADLLKLIFIMRNEGYTLIEIAEQAREDFAMEFDGCTQKDVVRVVSKLSNRNNGILQSLVAEILEQYE